MKVPAPTLNLLEEYAKLADFLPAIPSEPLDIPHPKRHPHLKAYLKKVHESVPKIEIEADMEVLPETCPRPKCGLRGNREVMRSHYESTTHYLPSPSGQMILELAMTEGRISHVR